MIILIGKAGTGKTSVADELFKRGYYRIVTCTTRPIRKGEQEGIDYFFLTEEQFAKFEWAAYFAEVRKYNTTQGIWKYGSPKVELLSATDKDVIILTPDGVRAIIPFLKEHMIDYTVVMIDSDDDVIRQRMYNRGDDEAEINRRIESDKEDFKDIADITDIIVMNNNDKSIEKVTDILLYAIE